MTVSAMQAQESKLRATHSSDVIAFNGEKQYSVFIILAPTRYNLTFKTSLDGDKSLIQDIEEEENGLRSEYILWFEAEKVKGAKLQIMSPLYETLELAIPANWQPDRAEKYIIDDPNDPLTKPVSEKHFMKGLQSFENSRYKNAKEEFLECLKQWDSTSDVDTSRVHRYIRDIDEILLATEKVKDEEEKSPPDYKLIYELYVQIFKFNPNDKDIEDKKYQAERKVRLLNEEYRESAENELRRKKDGDAAEKALNQIITLGYKGEDIEWATQRLKDVRDWKNLLSRHTLTYEYSEGASLGLSSGNYNVDNSSGYFTFRFDPKLLNAFNLKTTDSIQAETNLSFGFTIPLYHYNINHSSNIGLWLFFGPGVTVISKIGYQPDENSVASESVAGEDLPQIPKEEVENAEKFTNFHIAASPEAGFLLKLPIPKIKKHQIALRYTLQYHIPIKTDLFEDKKMSHVFGIGITF
jgi:hypothetical protein